MMVFQFPKQKVVFGPRQIVARINQDQVISPQITLWNQQGSEVIQGTLLVIPIEESLLYIRPLYLRSAGGRIPELKRVIVAYQNQIVMEETLDEALERLFPVGGQVATARVGRGQRRPPRPARRRCALGARCRALPARARGAARRRLGALRAGAPAARRAARTHGGLIPDTVNGSVAPFARRGGPALHSRGTAPPDCAGRDARLATRPSRARASAPPRARRAPRRDRRTGAARPRSGWGAGRRSRPPRGPMRTTRSRPADSS